MTWITTFCFMKLGVLALIWIANESSAIRLVYNSQLEKYLNYYGYTTPRGNTNLGIKLFQGRYNLQETGVLDEATFRLMTKDRCGNADNVTEGTPFAKGGTLYYSVARYSQKSNLHPSFIDRTLRDAFKVWSDVTPLRFTTTDTPSDADIKIEFVSRDHNCSRPFYGAGSFAHAFTPRNHGQIDSDIHFDDEEPWESGRKLFKVAVHEIGHSLGLCHSNVKEAFMFPWHPDNSSSSQRLHVDDIVAIQTLYHPPTDENLKWKEYGNYKYLFVDHSLRANHTYAKKYCELRDDAELLSLESSAEYDFIRRTAVSMDFTWLGLVAKEPQWERCVEADCRYHDCDGRKCEKHWKWPNGRSLGNRYRNWESKRPRYKERQCVRLIEHGWWRNVNCFDELRIICKKPKDAS